MRSGPIRREPRDEFDAHPSRRRDLNAPINRATVARSVTREALVVRNLDGSAKTDDQADKAMGRICRRASLPVRLFHTLRHYPDCRIIPREPGSAARLSRQLPKRCLADAG